MYAVRMGAVAGNTFIIIDEHHSRNICINIDNFLKNSVYQLTMSQTSRVCSCDIFTKV